MSKAAEERAAAVKRGRNRNAERSIRLLETAFVQLLSEKPYEKITVTDVTSVAGLNRGTFYAHFEGMDALRDTVFQGLADKLSSLIDKAIDASFVDDPLPALQVIGRYLNDNRELLQRLMRSKTLEPFLQSLQATLRAHVHEHLTEGDPAEASESLILADYLSYGILGAYRSWLIGEYGDMPIERVDEGLCELVKGARVTV